MFWKTTNTLLTCLRALLLSIRYSIPNGASLQLLFDVYSLAIVVILE